MPKIELTVGPFYAAVRQAAIVTSDERRGVDFTFGGGKIILAGHGAELGESHVELPIAYDGADIGITLDPRFLSDFLKVLDAEQTFTMELRDADSAAVCTTEDGYAYVVMPLARENSKPGQPAHLVCGARHTECACSPRGQTMTRGPQAIGNVLSELMSRRGDSRGAERAASDAAWREAAGPLVAEYTRVGQLRRGTLEVVVANSTLVQELGFQKRMLKVWANFCPTKESKISDSVWETSTSCNVVDQRPATAVAGRFPTRHNL